MFRMGRDEEYEGLRPDREVGEHDVPPTETRVNVVLEQVIRGNNVRQGGQGGRNHRGPGGRRGRRGGRGGPVALPQVRRDPNSIAENVDDDGFHTANGDNAARGRRRRGARSEQGGNRNVRQRSVPEEEDLSSDETTSQDESAHLGSASSDSSSSMSERSNDEQGSE